MAKPSPAKAFIFIAYFAILPLAANTAILHPQPAAPPPEGTQVNRYLEALLHCYPDMFTLRDTNTIVWNDGEIQSIDDGKLKDFETILIKADIEDQFSIPYPAGPVTSPPARNQDPGRIRNTVFFKKLYGSSAAEVQASLKPLIWMPGVFDRTILFNTRYGAWESLKKVSEELAALPVRFHAYLENIGGTYAWRPIQGTDRLSPHSFGIAIDINTLYSHYWLWDATYEYQNKIPMEIVEIFEKHGFIWGGKWYHYDTMHFEYRPELLW